MSTNLYFQHNELYERLKQEELIKVNKVNRTREALKEEYANLSDVSMSIIENELEYTLGIQGGLSDLALVHIGKLTGGKFYLHENNLYENATEMEIWYLTNEDNYDIVDEYGKKWSIEEVMKNVNEREIIWNNYEFN